ncbi:MAG: NRDE family protein [Thermodesulfobacteriota bacterium]
MCLIIFSFKQNKEFPLIIAANRDEFYERETKTLDLWNKNSDIIAGKDLKSGGTWMGINKKTKQFAAITNYRDPSNFKQDAKSRGIIVSSFLENEIAPDDFIKKLQSKKDEYNGFNLIAGNKDEIYYYSNISNRPEKLEPGIHGLSNHLLNTDWPKVEKSKKELEKTFKSENIIEDSIKVLLNDKTFPDNELPETGMGLEWERLLSPVFVKSEIYGTRASSVLIFDKNNKVNFRENAWLEESITKKTEFML